MRERDTSYIHACPAARYLGVGGGVGGREGGPQGRPVGVIMTELQPGGTPCAGES